MNNKVLISVGPSRVYLNYGELEPAVRFRILSTLRTFTKVKLTHMKYDFGTRTYSVAGEFFINDTRESVMYFPKPALGWLVEALRSDGFDPIEKLLPSYEVRKTTYTNRPNWTPYDYQEEAIGYLMGHTGDRRGLELETGCLVGSTIILYKLNGIERETTLRALYNKHYPKKTLAKLKVYSYNGTKMIWHNIHNIVYSEAKPVVELTLANGKSIVATGNHKIRTDMGYVELNKCIGKNIMCPIKISRNTLFNKLIRRDPMSELRNQVGYVKAVSQKTLPKEDTFDIQCHDPINNFTADGIVVHNSGKTCCANFTTMRLGQASMIVCGGLVEQWTRAIHEQMDVPDDAVYVIKEFKTIKKLWAMAPEDRPYLFVASWSTLRSYALGVGNYADFPPYSEFVKEFGIGIRIVDEAHLAFLATVTIDMCADIPTNIYLTATFLTSDSLLSNIFTMCFPHQMKYVGDRTQHCSVIAYGWSSDIPTTRTLNYGVYSHHKYEKIMMWNKRELFNPFMSRLIEKILNRHYINFHYEGKRKRALLFFAGKKMVHEVTKAISLQHPNLIVRSYLAGDSASILEEADVIVSTHKKAGTGTDIKDLVCVVNTVSFKAVTTAKQIVGRLRKLKGYVPEFIDLRDYNNFYHTRHFTIRSSYYKECAKTFSDSNINI